MLKIYYKKENVYVKVVITIRSCVPAWMLVICVMGGQGSGRLARDAVRHITLMCAQRYLTLFFRGRDAHVPDSP